VRELGIPLAIVRFNRCEAWKTGLNLLPSTSPCDGRSRHETSELEILSWKLENESENLKEKCREPEYQKENACHGNGFN